MSAATTTQAIPDIKIDELQSIGGWFSKISEAFLYKREVDNDGMPTSALKGLPNGFCLLNQKQMSSAFNMQSVIERHCLAWKGLLCALIYVVYFCRR